jgi:hypothetical protein
MVVRRESGLVTPNTHVCTLDPFGGLLSRPQTAIFLSKDFFKRGFERNRQLRTSTFRKITASFAALAVIVSLGTSPVLARGGGGGGHFGGGTFIGGGGFHAGGFGRGGFHPGGRMYGGAYSHHRFYGGYNACVVNPYYQWPNQYSSPYTC